jgi:hypothetical protein
MAVFWSLAARNVRLHPLRAALNVLGIALGVGLIFAVLALSQTLVSSFDNLYGSVYGDADLVVSGADGQGTINASYLHTIRSIGGGQDGDGRHLVGAGADRPRPRIQRADRSGQRRRRRAGRA